MLINTNKNTQNNNEFDIMPKINEQIMNHTIIIAVDGLSAAGKGTIAKKLADSLNFDYFSSGYVYRVIAFLAYQAQLDIHESNIKHTDFTYKKLMEIGCALTIDILLEHISKPQHLETPEISQYSSIIATIKELRDKLIVIQRDFAVGKTGLVMDGRDIGSVIFPDADYKFFIIASQEARAERRYEQLKNSMYDSKKITYQSVLSDIQERDNRDQNRNIAPAVAAKGAIIIDNTYDSVTATVEKMLKRVKLQNTLENS